MSELQNNNSASPYALVPELGDYVTFVSKAYKSTTGRIIYRSMDLIRIRPFTSSTTAVDFPLDTVDGQFNEELEVSEVIIHEKRKNPHFSRQLATMPGEILEFFNTDGTPSAESGKVFEVIATAEYDAIKLEDGQVIDFQFVGSPAPYNVIHVVVPPEELASPENESAEAANTAEPVEELFPEIDLALLPAALVEEIPTEERTFSDTVQREDMFVSLLLMVPEKRQKDPKVMKMLYRETDVLLALKNSVVERDESGAIVAGSEGRSYIAESIEEALEKQPTGAPISALLPVADVKKVLYVDTPNVEARDDVELRGEVQSLIDILKVESLFETQTSGNPFVTYINNYLQTFDSYTAKGDTPESRIRVDQDVLRTSIPPIPVEGFPTLSKSVTTKGEILPINADWLGTINDRIVRLIGPSKIVNPKTGKTFVVAPADSGETVGHVVLSDEMSAYRAPTRSSVLLWDIVASEASRAHTRTFYKRLMDTWEDQLSVNKTSGKKVSIAKLVSERLYPVYSFMNQNTVSLLDSLGLRNLEMTNEIMKSLLISIKVGQTTWNTGFLELQEKAKMSLDSEQKPVIPTIVSELFSEAVINAPEFSKYYAEINGRETSLKSYDLALSNGILDYAETTLGPYWYALAGGVDPALLSERAETFKSEYNRELRNTETIRELSKEFKAAPDINPCVHVNEFEKIRGIRNDEQRMLRFEKFVKQYMAGQNGNNLLCGTCGKDLVCKHEVMLLHEFLHPGRGVALHKSLLLEYSGPVFEGAYICKNCGQKISEIEYDTHLEFDDEGRPLVGRTVLEKEREIDETDFAVVIKDEDESKKLKFKDDDLAVYYIARTLFERAGIVGNDEMYERVVRCAQDYLKDPRRVFERKYYDERRADSLKTAKPGAPLRPTYDTFFANSEIGILGALVLLELQTSDVDVPFAASGCLLSRDGFPLDGPQPQTAGTGTLKYVACVIAGILRDDAPWNRTTWSPETGMKKRIDMCENAVLMAAVSLLCIKVGAIVPTPLTIFTDDYKTRLDAARAIKAAAASGLNMTLPSSSDVFPPSFRPIPRISDISVLEESSVGNGEKFMADVQSGDLLKVGPFVMSRISQIGQRVIYDFNNASKESGVVQSGNPRSDSACCFARLNDVGARGFGVSSVESGGMLAEVLLQTRAAEIIHARDPASSAAGSHILVPWSAPSITTVLPEADPSVYYKLFLKHCFVEGRNYGGVHELGPDHRCRNCRFAYPAELVYLTGSEIPDDRNRSSALESLYKRREAIALEAFASQGVEINESTFRSLENAIRQSRYIPAVQPVLPTLFMDTLAGIQPMFVLMPPFAVKDWELLTTAMRRITDGKLKDGPLRRRELGAFSKNFDSLSATTDEVFQKLLGKTPAIRATITSGLQMVKTITEDVNNALKNIQDTFVLTGQQITAEYAVTKVQSYKWFPKINLDHKQKLDIIWSNAAAVITHALEVFKDMEESLKTLIKTAFDRYTTAVSAILSIWRRNIRVGVDFTPLEYSTVLQWITFSGIQSLVDENSPMLAGAFSPKTKTAAAKFFAQWVLDTLSATVKYTKSYQLTPEQIEESMNIRAELERMAFINKFDKLDRDLRKVELIKKGLKIGDWAVGTVKNLFTYDADFFEFERAQRADMGLPEFGDHINAAIGATQTAGERYGFFSFGEGGGEGYDTRMVQDEDAI